jgi:Tfp pilus assembly protein PilP
MKLTTGILAIAMMAGAGWAENPDAIAAQTAKPAPGSPAPTVKPATIPAAKPVPAPAATPAAASGQHNQLRRVNVVQSADGIRIEISSSRAVKPRVSKLASPARVLVELPETAVAVSQNHIAVGNAGVKGVRIGMDGKTPPTTSIVVDLEKPLPYELTPGPADKLVLTLQTQEVAKSNPAPVKMAAAPVQTAAKNAAPAAMPQPTSAKPAVAAKPTVATKPAVAAKPTVATKPAVAAKPAAAVKAEAPKATTKIAAPKVAAKESKTAAPAKSTPEADTAKKAAASQPKPEEKKWAMNGKRDPFFSPVVQQQGGSGCSTGKKCLEIGAINLRGVVKSDNGFIAVVTNNLNKAYFLRENDPVFNGYVVKITGDSVVFQETLQDKLGKTFTREVVKRIFTPAV